jgi:hypothetical protein
MDYDKLLAEKDAEILELRSEIERLKSKFDEKDLEEINVDGRIEETDTPIVLKVPEELENEGVSGNVFDNQSAFLNFMNFMISRDSNQFEQDDVNGGEEEESDKEEEADKEEEEADKEEEEADKEEEEADKEEDEEEEISQTSTSEEEA